jgi:hypothetical protein
VKHGGYDLEVVIRLVADRLDEFQQGHFVRLRGLERGRDLILCCAHG